MPIRRKPEMRVESRSVNIEETPPPSACPCENRSRIAGRSGQMSVPGDHGLAQRFDGKPWGDRSLLTADVYEADPRFLPKGGFP